MTRHDSVRFKLLDQQIVDSEHRPVGRVDDLVLRLPAAGGEPEVTAALTGAQVLGERLGGAIGGVMAGVARRLRGGEHPGPPVAVPAELIGEHEDLIVLSVPARELPDVMGLERWLARHVVEGLPGAGDARL